MGRSNPSMKFVVAHRSENDVPDTNDPSSKFVLMPLDTKQPDNGTTSAITELKTQSDTLDPNFATTQMHSFPTTGPRDVMQALHDDDDFEDLEEDFMMQAMGDVDEAVNADRDYDDVERKKIDDDDDDDDEEYSELDVLTESLKQGLLRICSSDDEEDNVWPEIAPRSGLLGDVDNAFSSFINKYDDDEIGELEGDPDVVGASNVVDDNVLDQFLLDADTVYVPGEHESKEASEVIAITRQLAKQQVDENDDDFDENTSSYLKRAARDEWDCASIISSYSNLENHPNLIREPLSKRQLKHQLREEADTQTDVSDGDVCVSEDTPVINEGKARAKTESGVEKRGRKAAVKEMRRQRRKTKKSMKTAFAKETAMQSNALQMQQTRNPNVLRI